MSANLCALLFSYVLFPLHILFQRFKPLCQFIKTIFVVTFSVVVASIFVLIFGE
ncbi:hypothetical protein BKA69DRAFT_1102111 [Paraphysoderma sedebokerense]|nr:hypothetical protein BKA69DRAFT_1102111 [Paraphysoderma sedebokerense]